MRGVVEVIVDVLRATFPPKPPPMPNPDSAEPLLRDSRYWQARGRALVAEARVHGRSIDYQATQGEE